MLDDLPDRAFAEAKPSCSARHRHLQAPNRRPQLPRYPPPPSPRGGANSPPLRAIRGSRWPGRQRPVRWLAYFRRREADGFRNADGKPPSTRAHCLNLVKLNNPSEAWAYAITGEMRQPRRDPTDAERAAVRATVAAHCIYATENNTTTPSRPRKTKIPRHLPKQMHAVRAHQPPPQPTPTSPPSSSPCAQAAGILSIHRAKPKAAEAWPDHQKANRWTKPTTCPIRNRQEAGAGRRRWRHSRTTCCPTRYGRGNRRKPGHDPHRKARTQAEESGQPSPSSSPTSCAAQANRRSSASPGPSSGISNQAAIPRQWKVFHRSPASGPRMTPPHRRLPRRCR